MKQKVQVLASAMNQKDHSILEEMKIQTDAIIINQSDKVEEEQITYKGRTIKFYTFNERGIGVSRNNAILRSSNDICVFADEDEFFVDDYEKIILEEFKNNPKADMILFNVPSTNPKQPTVNIRKKSRVRKYNSLRYGAVNIAVKMDKLKKKTIFFSLLFLCGAKYSSGEDSWFIYQCVKNKMKVYTSPQIIGYVRQEESTWFTGYNDKYFKDKGAFFCCLSNRWAKLLGLQFAIRKYKNFSKYKKLSEIVKLINQGILEFRQEENR